ncbi:hypothetical protein J7E63_14325 [Bacillus sp. ISL-75]|nr:hypothetical protein [Bacillus sp. ISL-75]
MFAIDADYFNWGYAGRWVSFLATPTASWAMYSNMLIEENFLRIIETCPATQIYLQKQN